MHTSIRDGVLLVSLCVCGTVAIGARTPQDHQRPPEGGVRQHRQAARIRNAVPSSAASIAAGQELYQQQCAGCHGDTGQGDGALGEELNPKPSNLTDADWKHGSTDGEIYTVIREGVKSTGMKGYSRKMTTYQVWDVVNYV
ncbi:MAG: c-type cytochrome, partial [Terriglobia bacterium]